MSEPYEFPWKPGDEFDLAMCRLEKVNPAGPSNTIVRRLLWWNLRDKWVDVWQLPEDTGVWP